MPQPGWLVAATHPSIPIGGPLGCASSPVHRKTCTSGRLLMPGPNQCETPLRWAFVFFFFLVDCFNHLAFIRQSWALPTPLPSLGLSQRVSSGKLILRSRGNKVSASSPASCVPVPGMWERWGQAAEIAPIFPRH